MFGFVNLHQRIWVYHTQYWPQNYFEQFKKSDYDHRISEIDKYYRYPINWLKNPQIPYFEKNVDNKDLYSKNYSILT